MSIHESQFPLYLNARAPANQRLGPPVARTVETTATVLVDLDIHGRVIGVEILGEVPTETQWGVGWSYREPPDYDIRYSREAAEKVLGERRGNAVKGNEHLYKLLRRQVTETEWVEVDEKEVSG